jgi:hypothetical protein
MVTQQFFWWKDSQIVGSLSSICAIFCFVLCIRDKADWSSEQWHLLLAHVHQGYIMYQRTGFVNNYCRMLNSNNFGQA